MRGNKEKFSNILIILICALFFLQIGLKSNTLTSYHQNTRLIISAEFISHISIDGNNDLAFHPNVKGFGTWMQPYIIENYVIEGPGNIGINITNTNKPLIIYNCTIENFNYGIWLQNTSNVKIYNNTVDGINGLTGGTGGLGKHGGIGVGIYLTIASNNSITGNTLTNIAGGIGERDITGGNGGIGAGIYLLESFNNNLTDNTIMEIDGGTGGEGFMWMHLDGYGGHGNIGAGIYSIDSDNNSLNSNIIANIRGGNGGEANYYYGGDGGIGAGLLFMDSSNNSIIFNNIDIIKGGKGGVSMFGGDGDNGMGIHLTSSSNNNFINNSINQIFGGNSGVSFISPYEYPYVNRDGRSDYGFGIYLSSSSNNNFTANTIMETIGGYSRTSIPRYKTGYGMRLYSGTTNNLMHLNSFIDNSINAYGGDLSNKWDNGSIGNFWDDYQGIDIDDDGIGDSPYYIQSSSSRDNYPIWDDGPTPDITTPSININFPNPNEIFGSEAPMFNVDSPDQDIDTLWYSVNDGNNITFTSNGSIDQTEWNPLSDGIVWIYFYANDTVGNIGFEIVNVEKDTTAPTIIIYSPYSDEGFSSKAPAFNVDSPDQDIDTLWYSVNDGKNITFTSNGSVDQTEWDSLSDDMVTISFYVNDTVGNIGFEIVNVEKDTTAPTIIIYSPYSDEIFSSEAPAFNVYNPDQDIDTLWYTLNDGKSITFTSNGSIDQTEWESLIDGTVKITFYAIDTLGNLASASIDIRKNTDNQDDRNKIPSFPILIFISIITLTLIVSMEFIRKKVDFQ